MMDRRNLAADIDVIAAAVIDALFVDTCEYGAIGVDAKRPFGNSDVEGDMLQLLGCKPDGNDGEDECWSSQQREYVRDIYRRRVIPRIQETWKQRK